MSLLHYMYVLKTKIIQCIFVPLFEHHPIERRKFIHTVLRYSSAECTVLLMSFVGKRYFATVALTVLGQTCPQQLFCRVWGPEPQRQFYLVPWDWMTLWFQKTCDRQWGQPNNTGTVSWKPKKKMLVLSIPSKEVEWDQRFSPDVTEERTGFIKNCHKWNL